MILNLKIPKRLNNMNSSMLRMGFVEWVMNAPFKE